MIDFPWQVFVAGVVKTCGLELMLVLVGAVKMSDRIVHEITGL